MVKTALMLLLFTPACVGGDATRDFRKISDHFRKRPRERAEYLAWLKAGKKLCDEFVTTWEAKADEGENRYLLAQVYYRYFAGRFYRKEAEKHYGKAQEHLKAFLAKNPDHAQAKRLLGWVERAQKRARYRAEAESKRKALVGQPAPEIKFDEVLDGKGLTPAALKGKVVVLDFWATWCGPCRRVIPHLVELQKSRGEKGLQIVGVTRFYTFGYSQGKTKRKLKPEEERQVNRECAKELGINYPIVFSKEGAKGYWVTGIPQLVVLDRKGVVRYVKVGAGDHAELDKTIEACLAEGANGGSKKGS